jgi:hypothetical protein
MSVHKFSVLALVLGGMLAPAARPTTSAPAPVRAAAARPFHTDEPPAGLSREEWSQIRGLVEKGRYHASSVAKPGEPKVLKASNPGQGYVTTFRPEGIEIASRPVRGTDWRVRVRVTGFGPEGDVRPLPVAKPVPESERVVYRRGPVTEWYENRPGGLEQGFTIAEPEKQTSRPLVLAMAVEGGLRMRLEAADAASFHDGAGIARVHYAGLKAWDMDRRPLRSWLEVSEGQLRVLVDARDARFPVTVDPAFVQQARLEASEPAASDYFGYSVSLSSDTVVVGAPFADTAAGMDAGAAYVFVRTGAVWSQQQKLTASDATAEAYFGSSVSVSGNTAVVGAYGDDAPWLDSGSAYVFVRSGTAWTQQQKVTASDGMGEDFFGCSVSVSGDTAVIGAYWADKPPLWDTGAAYVFVRSGTLWTQQQKLTASDAAESDRFGRVVSLSGNTVVAGADGADTAAGTNAGSAYVFVRSGTAWSQQQKLTASDAAAGDAFGCSVSVSGDTAVVGAYGADTAFTDAGSAYVFVRSGTAWSQQQKLTASDAAAADYFGLSVSVSANTAVIGAYGDDTAAGTDAGSAYVFVRSATGWSEQQHLAASDAGASDRFGYVVAASGGTAVVGAHRDDTAAGVDAGSAYVFSEVIFKDGFQPVAAGRPETENLGETLVPQRDGGESEAPATS